MHWKDGDPSFNPLLDLSRRLKASGYTAHFFFDANAGHVLADRYLHDQDFEKLMKLQPGRVTVVPKGTPADSAILDMARRLNAVVVTNDRYRDWADKFPEVHRKGFLIKGGYSAKGLTLDEAIAQPVN